MRVESLGVVALFAFIEEADEDDDGDFGDGDEDESGGFSLFYQLRSEVYGHAEEVDRQHYRQPYGFWYFSTIVIHRIYIGSPLRGLIILEASYPTFRRLRLLHAGLLLINPFGFYF